MGVKVMSIVVGALGTIPKGLGEKRGGIGNHSKSWNHPNYSIKIG